MTSYIVKQSGKKRYLMTVSYDEGEGVREFMSTASTFNARRYGSESEAADVATAMSEKTGSGWEVIERESGSDHWSNR